MGAVNLLQRIGLRPEHTRGLLLSIVVAAMGFVVARFEELLIGQAVIEGLVVALLIGVILRNILPADLIASFAPGANYASRQVLELGVLLLGAAVSFPVVFAAGPILLGFIILSVIAAILIGFGIGRVLGLGWQLALLVAVGNGICGNSAIAAVAPVIKADRKDVASAIGLTAILGLLLVLGLPFLIGPLLLSHYQYGVLAGMAVYAVPQVIAAAFPVSQLSGEVATTVKLTRVLLIGPVVIAASLLFRHGSGRGLASFLPWFVIGFLILAAARSTSLLPTAPAELLREGSRALTLVAMAGLGFGVEIAAVRAVGARVAAAVLASLTFLLAVTLGALRIGGIDG
ncbi:MAG: putative sulfate exporter family transporter [Chloroflexi bacterium]|nr:putative sulfate exporter family transporter [Chloroflexota bacterium]